MKLAASTTAGSKPRCYKTKQLIECARAAQKVRLSHASPIAGIYTSKCSQKEQMAWRLLHLPGGRKQSSEINKLCWLTFKSVGDTLLFAQTLRNTPNVLLGVAAVQKLASFNSVGQRGVGWGGIYFFFLPFFLPPFLDLALKGPSLLRTSIARHHDWILTAAARLRTACSACLFCFSRRLRSSRHTFS